MSQFASEIVHRVRGRRGSRRRRIYYKSSSEELIAAQVKRFSFVTQQWRLLKHNLSALRFLKLKLSDDWIFTCIHFALKYKGLSDKVKTDLEKSLCARNFILHVLENCINKRLFSTVYIRTPSPEKEVWSKSLPRLWAWTSTLYSWTMSISPIRRCLTSRRNFLKERRRSTWFLKIMPRYVLVSPLSSRSRRWFPINYQGFRDHRSNEPTQWCEGRFWLDLCRFDGRWLGQACVELHTRGSN